MTCDCAALKTEILSQRKLMVGWFESLMTELQEVKSELSTKLNTFNIGDQQSPPVQPLNSDSAVSAPFAASIFLKKNLDDQDSGDVDSSHGSGFNQFGISLNPNSELQPAAESAIGMLSPKLEPGCGESSVEINQIDTGQSSFFNAGPHSTERMQIKPFQTKSMVGRERSSAQNGSENPTAQPQQNNLNVFRQADSYETPLSSNFNNPLYKSEKKLYACNQCEYKSRRMADLLRHKNVHEVERKRYSCDLCDFTCKQPSYFVIHKRTHTGEKLFSCDKCPFKTSVSSSLYAHKRRHAGEKPFSCSYCDYRCSQKTHMQDHLRTHTGEKPFACDQCDYRTGRKFSLREHRKRKHKTFYNIRDTI